MKKLSDFFTVENDVFINDIVIDSRLVKKNDMFVCVKGINSDRHDFIPVAIANGASCIVGSKDIKCSVPYIKVDDPDAILVDLCKKNYDFDDTLKIIGVTGTDGKTTTTTCVQTLIGSDLCGYIGTNGISCKKFSDTSNNSTPDPTILYKSFKRFKDAGCKYVVMEASSEGLYRKRLDGLDFIVGAYTNVTWEHINVHKTFENYLNTKVSLVDKCKECFIVNLDEENHEKFMKPGKKILSYGTKEICDLYIKNYHVEDRYTNVTFIYDKKEYTFISPLLGKFNVYNLACSMLICLSLGFSMEDLIKNVLDIDVSGRMEVIDMGQPFKVLVDYAHTPNAIEAVLEFVHTLNVDKSIVVVGSAGERDIKKRPVMGSTVIKNASYAIFTSDDPRSEDPYVIASQMAANIKDKSKYEIETDRSLAIKKAIDMAGDNDIVLALGKGNEKCQKLATGPIYYNDIEECKKWLKERIERDNLK